MTEKTSAERSNEHHFHRELAELNTMLASIGGLVEENLRRALNALKSCDQKLAEEVKSVESQIDSMEVEIEEFCLKILALYQPVARDLRFLITIIKVLNELERMGDLAEKIAKVIGVVSKEQIETNKMELFVMGNKTQKMVSLALDALLKKDADTAREVCMMDDEVDKLHKTHHIIIAKGINSDAVDFTLAELKLLSVSRALERIADAATRICEDVIYLVDAKIIRHKHDY